MEKSFYEQSQEEVVSFLKTDIESGLSSEDAKERLRKTGYNEFEKKKHRNVVLKFFDQFKSFMILVLLAAAVISGITGYLNGEGFTDAIIILAIVVLNAIIGVVQEEKAEKSLEALEKLSAPHCKVIRDGEMHVIASRELVPGDVVVLDTGDSVPADLRLTEVANLKIQEAALTGESVPVEKNLDTVPSNATIGDRINMAFGSCSVTYGRGKGIVVATGHDTEVGKIAAMLQSVPDVKTPLQKRLDQLGKVLAIAALIICALIFIIGILYGNDLLTMFMTAVSLAAAAIPEGLPAVSTILLAVGVQRLAKRNAIVRNMPSVETLGSVTVICSDKTGTLTQNKMTVVKTYVDGELQDADFSSANVRRMAIASILANDGELVHENGVMTGVGDPTETALLDLGMKHNLEKEALEDKLPRIAEVPFDSERKLMSTVNRHVDTGELMVSVKGGLDELLLRCDRIYDHDTIRPITQADKERLSQVNLDIAGKALRVLAMATATIETLPAEITSETIEKNLIFIGMVGMIDPPREEVKTAVAECRAAGIKPVMITGDHKITATAIASSLGIMGEDSIALTGAEIDSMTDKELEAVATKTSVFARVSPEHKVRIVNTFQKQNNVVAMTGDGVNDAPALKLADIGVAMGITGTDVSKEAADVVLTDDNFATIVSSVSEGRRIYDNIIKAIQFMLSTNLGEILTLFIAVICNWAAPLLPIQILWINLVSDSLPGLALSMDPAEKNVMRRKPIDPKKGIMTGSFLCLLLLQGLLISVLTLTAYKIGLHTSLDVARSMTFATLVFTQMFIIFSIRTKAQSAFKTMFTNGYLLGAIAIVVVLTLAVMIIPGVQDLFKLTNLNGSQWLYVVGLSFSALIINDIGKIITRCLKNQVRGNK